MLQDADHGAQKDGGQPKLALTTPDSSIPARPFMPSTGGTSVGIRGAQVSSMMTRDVHAISAHFHLRIQCTSVMQCTATFGA